MPKVAIVILNWNRSKDTLECLTSVENLFNEGFELLVIVVDNASSEELGIENKNVKIIRNDKNYGFAKGNNIGIEYALQQGVDYVVILNNDTIVERNSINELVKLAQTDPMTGAISPKIYFAEGFEFAQKYKKDDLGKVIWYAGGVIDWLNIYGSTRGVDQVDRGQYGNKGQTDFATGTCMLLTRKALEKVGMYDQRYYMYYEDTDLSMRIKNAGFKIMYNPESVVWHKVAQSSGIGSGLNDYFTTRNRLLFGFKYATLRTRFALFRESIKLLLTGREWQKVGVKDYYLGKFEQGSWKSQQ